MAAALERSPMYHRWCELGLDADGVAKQVGVHRSFVYDVAKGVKRPSLKTAIRFSEVLQCSLQEIFPDLFAPMDST